MSANKQGNPPTCFMTMGEWKNYYPCGKPAKFKEPGGKHVCGIHANQINRRQERLGDKMRCVHLSVLAQATEDATSYLVEASSRWHAAKAQGDADQPTPPTVRPAEEGA